MVNIRPKLRWLQDLTGSLSGISLISYGQPSRELYAVYRCSVCAGTIYKIDQISAGRAYHLFHISEPQLCISEITFHKLEAITDNSIELTVNQLAVVEEEHVEDNSGNREIYKTLIYHPPMRQKCIPHQQSPLVHNCTRFWPDAVWKRTGKLSKGARSGTIRDAVNSVNAWRISLPTRDGPADVGVGFVNTSHHQAQACLPIMNAILEHQRSNESEAGQAGTEFISGNHHSCLSKTIRKVASVGEAEVAKCHSCAPGQQDYRGERQAKREKPNLAEPSLLPCGPSLRNCGKYPEPEQETRKQASKYTSVQLRTPISSAGEHDRLCWPSQGADKSEWRNELRIFN